MNRSFTAMFWGWVAANTTLAFLYSINAWETGWGAFFFLLLWILWSACISAIVIFCAWLVIFLPTDFLVKETSFLREPQWAGTCGALAGFLSTSLPLIFRRLGQGDFTDTLILSLPAAVCGLTASLHLVHHHPRLQPDDEPPLTQATPMNTLTLFYDARCGLCSQVRQWLVQQPAYVRLEFVPYDSPEAIRRLPAIRHLQADQEIVVMADSGEVWQGAGAWVICLWALKEYRTWSARMATPTMQAMARKMVHWISQNRIGLSRLLSFQSDAELAAVAERDMQEPTCRIRHDLDLID